MFEAKIKSAGTTLIELMIALMISSLLLSCLITIFVATKRNQQILNSLNLLQDSLRDVSQLFNSEIHLAGYIGCAKLTNDFPLKSQFYELSNKNKITHYRDKDIKKNSDGFSFAHASQEYGVLMKSMRGYAVTYVSAVPRFLENDLVLISSCSHAEVAKIKSSIITSDGLQQITFEKPLSNKYSAYNEISLLIINHYYIGKSTDLTQLTLSEYALYQKDIHLNKQEVLDGVENMQAYVVVLKDKQLVEIPINQFKNDQDMVAFTIKLTMSPIMPGLSKKDFYIYAALKQ